MTSKPHTRATIESVQKADLSEANKSGTSNSILRWLVTSLPTYSLILSMSAATATLGKHQLSAKPPVAQPLWHADGDFAGLLPSNNCLLREWG